jgi:hypothetical protein
MMNCYASGLLGLSLLGGSLLTMSVSQEQHDKLQLILSDELDVIYDGIVRERRNHYLLGLLLGMLLSAVVVGRNPSFTFGTRVAYFLAITLSVAVIVYTFLPKSDYMLHHLKSPEENRAWLEMYQTMKQRYMVGFLLGALAAIPMANMICSM